MSQVRSKLQVERKDVERALLGFFGREESDKYAFRARLRHLSSLGYLSLPKVGSGKRVTYGLPDIFWMALSLQLELLGQSPKRTVEILTVVRAQVALPIPADVGTYVVIEPARVNVLEGPRLEQLLPTLLSVSAVNLLGIAYKLLEQFPSHDDGAITAFDELIRRVTPIGQAVYEGRDGDK